MPVPRLSPAFLVLALLLTGAAAHGGDPVRYDGLDDLLREVREFDSSGSASLSPTSAAEVFSVTAEEPFLEEEPPPESSMPQSSPGADADANSGDARFDPALVAQGEAAFQRGCLDCHDAARSFDKRKSYSGWVATVRRMAAKDGANVAEGDIDPIATYLASRTVTGPDTGGGGLLDALSAADSLSFNATVSTLWRSGEDNHTLESPGFFPDVWLGTDWQPDGPLSAKVMACTSCHSDSGFTFELVEASASLDLLRTFCGERRGNGHRPCAGWEAGIKAGRFVVPFGAFAAMSHPGAYRTLTNPLIYDMGRDVFFAGGPFVVPIVMQPYSDEGAQVSVRMPLPAEWHATFDAYAVNGLRDASLSFFTSRSYRDNNREPAVGGRATISSSHLRFGGSIMAGNSGPDGPGSDLHYVAAGGDLTARVSDILRLYLEYAWRRHDSVLAPTGEDEIQGYVAEAELFVWRDPGLSLLARYDTLESDFAGAILTGGEVERFTWGLNIGLPGGSLLLIHHEHWNPQPGNHEYDLVGARWTCSF